MKKISHLLQKKITKVLGLVTIGVLGVSKYVYAAVDTSLVTSLFDIICTVMKIFGGALGFIGALEFFIGLFGSDPGSRNLGIKLFFCGVLVIALSASRAIFGL